MPPWRNRLAARRNRLSCPGHPQSVLPPKRRSGSCCFRTIFAAHRRRSGIHDQSGHRPSAAEPTSDDERAWHAPPRMAGCSRRSPKAGPQSAEAAHSASNFGRTSRFTTAPRSTPKQSRRSFRTLSRRFMGPIVSDLEEIRATGTDTVEIDIPTHRHRFFWRRSKARSNGRALLRSGTGPYIGAPGSMTAFEANASYYLGKPAIEHIDVTTYPDRARRMGRAAARSDRHAVGGRSRRARFDDEFQLASRSSRTRAGISSSLPSIQSARAVASKEVRRALNTAIDRDALGEERAERPWRRFVRAWSGRSTGRCRTTDRNCRSIRKPRGPRRRTAARRRPNDRIHFTCLIPPDAAQRKGRARGETPVGGRRSRHGASRRFRRNSSSNGSARAITRRRSFEFISGPTLFRPYLVWHSGAPFNWGHFGGPNIDKALDAVRFSGSDTDYRTAVASLNQIFADDPPAVFLAWQERARAVSRRFSVPSEPGRDILGTLRLWKPAADTRQASRN